MFFRQLKINYFESAFYLLFQIFKHLSLRRQIQILASFFIILSSALSELISIASIVPVLGVLADPSNTSMFGELPILSTYTSTGNSNYHFLLTSIFFILITAIASGLKIFNAWYCSRLSAVVSSDLSIEIYKRNILQPYLNFNSTNSTLLTSTIATNLGRATNAFSAFLTFATSLFVSLLILVGLFAYSSQIAMAIVFIFGAFYSITVVLLRRRLSINALNISRASKTLYKFLQETSSAFRDIYLESFQGLFVSEYSSIDRNFRLTISNNNFIALFPKSLFEFLGIATLLLIALVLLYASPGPTILPTLGLFAFGAQKLFPSLQQSFSSWARLTSFTSCLKEVLTESTKPCQADHILTRPRVSTIDKFNTLIFDKVNFKYSFTASSYDLKDISFSLSSGQVVGVVGASGSGKSTLVDLILCLIEPTSGTVTLDGHTLVNIEHNDPFKASWMKSIAHVPQTIFLADVPLIQNIAFGVPAEDIDLSLVDQAAKFALINDDFFSADRSIFASAGENGSSLSGGQRQRIGLARAFYKKSPVWILDEATSALDQATESIILGNLFSLTPQPTIVIISHREQTLAVCDLILRIEHGRIIESGPPSTVLHHY